MNKVVLGLGSNIGNREENLLQCIDLVNQNDFLEVTRVSKFRETKPVSRVSQPDFLNGAILIETLLSPREVFAWTVDVEKQMGRTLKGNHDPRIIDIDVLMYGDTILSQDDLTIPHALMHERGFVLEPLVDIVPDMIHPVLRESVTDLFSKVVGY